ncbi:A1 cistron-splicing factor [Dendryphion nanum]|uniref:A1 cistron-splicing factor n=1 Tax=Dendryphion nanum TaxID=256645 RepID=A0A9P9EK89_9PLEO|nr:A1 cistron-splicing factor [Dendryphion nanum]
MDPASQTHCVLLVHLPPSALAGIDLLSFTTTPRFRGVKNLPPGLHFVFASSDTSLSVRHGAWFYVSPGAGAPQVFIKKWDPSTEDLVAEKSQTEVLRWRANLGSIWNESLTPYRQTVQSGESGEEDSVSEESADWSSLTSKINSTLLSRICGLNPDHWSLSSSSSAAQDLEQIPGIDTEDSILNPEKELNFLPIDLKRTWRVGATGRERTDAAQDRSWALGDLIDNQCHGDNARSRESEILGEVQFCFLMILTLNNNSCLEQWKRLLGVLFTCRQAIKERTYLFLELLKGLRLQLSHLGDMEASMFDLNEHNGGFLPPLLRRFKKTLDELEGNWKMNLVNAFEELEDFVKTEFGWNLDDSYVKRGLLELEDGERVEMDVNGADEDDETGEYAPTIVDLTPEQMKALQGHRNNGGAQIAELEEEEDDAELEDMDTRY